MHHAADYLSATKRDDVRPTPPALLYRVKDKLHEILMATYAHSKNLAMFVGIFKCTCARDSTLACIPLRCLRDRDDTDANHGNHVHAAIVCMLRHFTGSDSSIISLFAGAIGTHPYKAASNVFAGVRSSACLLVLDSLSALPFSVLLHDVDIDAWMVHFTPNAELVAVHVRCRRHVRVW